MKSLILNSVGASGINADVQPWDLPAEFITDGINFRVINDGILSMPYDQIWFDLEVYNIGHLFPSRSASESFILIATDVGIFAFDGSVALPVLTTSIVDPHLWSYGVLGGVPCFNHPDVGAFFWYPREATQAFTPLPFSTKDSTVWDSTLGKSAKVIRAHGNFLFMLNLTETINGTTEFLTDSYRWSHPATDSDSVPVTWDETDNTFLAGISPLGGNTGVILDGRSLRDSFVIYSERGINVLDLSGDTFVWNRRQVSATEGLLSKDCLVEVGGFHYFITPTDIMRFDGSNIESIIHKRLRKHFRSSLSAKTYTASFATVNFARKEIWFCIPTGGDFTVSLAYIYNYVDDTWSLKSLPPGTAHIVYSSRPSSGIDLWSTLRDKVPTSTWSSYGKPWGSSYLTPFDETMVAGRIDGTLWDVDTQRGTDVSLLNQDGAVVVPSSSFIERTNYAIEGINNDTTITSVFPKIAGTSPVKIKFGSHDRPGGPVRWKQEITYDPSKQRTVQVRTTGALHAWRIESIGDTTFTFTGMEINYVNAGLR